MNILICSNEWAPSVGGVQSVTNTLALGLAGRTSHICTDPIQLTVVTGTLPGGAITQDGVLPVIRDAGVPQLLRLLWKSDLVHLAGPSLLPLFLAWVLRKKVVIQHHGYQAVCPDGSLVHFVEQRVCCDSFATGDMRDCLRCRMAKGGRVRGLLSVALAYPRLWLCRHVAANVAVSEHVNQRLGLPRTTTIYNAPADPDDSATGPETIEPCQAATAARDVPLIVFIGRLTSEKGVTVLLHAASVLAAEDVDFRLRIIGDGPERARLAVLAWSLRLRDRVEFTGMLQGRDLEAAVKDALVVVLPSLVEETAGMVAIEQMMRGRVIIASDVGGLGEVVGDAGLKFPPGDIAALAECLRRVLADQRLNATLGGAARSRALQHFTRERMVDEHMQLYRRILRRAS